MRIAMEKSKAESVPQEEEKKVEEPVSKPVSQPPAELIEIKTPAGLSDAELRKLEELKKLKAQKKIQKQEGQVEEQQNQSKPKADALPPVMM
jgi:hypothetical protein